MRAIGLGLVVLVSVGTAAPALGRSPVPHETPPPAYIQGDPADSLYRAARTALNQRDYAGAAALFGRISARYPKSGYAADALYWQAFAQYRLGSDQQLRGALRALERQRRSYPEAGTRGDAAALERRILGELARRGDADAAAAIAAEAARIAAPPVPPVPPVAPAAPVAPATPARPTTPATPARPRTPPMPSGPTTGVIAPDMRGLTRQMNGLSREMNELSRSLGALAGDAACSAADADTKIAALNALQQMDPERAAPVLKRVLAKRDSGSTCLRRKALFLLAQQGREEDVDVLLQSARTDPDAEVREQAVFWLSQAGSERSVAALDSILRTTTDPQIQDKAVFALSQVGSEHGQQALRAYAQRADVPEPMREKAIFWLGQSGRSEDQAFLRSLYGKLKSDELKTKVLFSVAQTGTDESQRWLLDVARNPKEPLAQRKHALYWASQGGARTEDVARVYATTAERELREQVLFVLSQRGDSAAADRLVDVARHDPDPALRQKALFWLGQMDDPRAAQLLQEIIEK